MSDKEFCEIYTAYHGETIDKVGQLSSGNYTGEDLKEFIEFCIKEHEAKGCEHIFEYKHTNWYQCTKCEIVQAID